MDILRSITPANPLNRTWGQNLGGAFKLALGSMAVASVLDVTGIYENNFGILKNVVDPIGEAQITSYGCPSISHLSSSEKISAMIDSMMDTIEAGTIICPTGDIPLHAHPQDQADYELIAG